MHRAATRIDDYAWQPTDPRIEQGKPIIERVDPLEMVWDSAAKKRNLTDMRRVFHIKRDVPIEEARALCPGDPSNPFEDEDYNATWVDGKDEKSEHHNDNRFYNKDGTTDGQSADKSVTMVRAQWWERVPVYLVLNPLNPDEVLTLEEDEFKNLKAKAKIANGSLQFVKQTRKVFKQAFLGSVLLEVGPAPCDERFSFNCMTGNPLIAWWDYGTPITITNGNSFQVDLDQVGGVFTLA